MVSEIISKQQKLIKEKGLGALVAVFHEIIRYTRRVALKLLEGS